MGCLVVAAAVVEGALASAGAAGAAGAGFDKIGVLAGGGLATGAEEEEDEEAGVGFAACTPYQMGPTHTHTTHNPQPTPIQSKHSSSRSMQ